MLDTSHRLVPTELEPEAPRRTFERLRTIGPLGAVGLVFAVGLPAGGLVLTQTTEIMASVQMTTHDPTPAERTILSGLEDSVLERPSTFACVPELENTEIAISNAEPLFGKPYIHMLQSYCDQLIGYIDLEDKSEVSVEMVNALDAAVHETEHIDELIRGEENEHQAACLAFQELPKFAQALGASIEEAAEAQRIDKDIYMNHRLDMYKHPDCRDGGPYDLDPDQLGFFPTGPFGPYITE